MGEFMQVAGVGAGSTAETVTSGSGCCSASAPTAAAESVAASPCCGTSVQAQAEAVRRPSLVASLTPALPALAAAAPAAQGTLRPGAALPQRADSDPPDVLGSAECDALRRTLEACRWNISATAVRLHLSRRTIYRKMYRHGIARHDLDEAADK